MKKLLFSIYYRIHVLSGLKNIDNGNIGYGPVFFGIIGEQERSYGMKISVQKESEIYLLTISYTVPTSLAEAWDLLATDSGFARWFPQLNIVGNTLVFEMEGFREVMDLLEYRKNEKIAYTWDSAIVSFTLSQLENQTLITFEERIPEDFGNEFANAPKDMTGWLVQNECIKKVLEGQESPVRQPLQEKWRTFLELELEGL